MDTVIKDLNKAFGDNQVLKGFSARFPEHKITCIMGKSGYGKTTLLNILMGLLPADSGSVEGIPPLFSAVFQENRLCDSFTAYSNIRMACKKSVSSAYIRKHLIEVGLKDSLDEPVRILSGGMKRRVSIVRAVLADGDMIFMDEPFKGLDDKTKAVTAEYVKRHRRDRTVLMVTHSREETDLMGGQIFYMDLPASSPAAANTHSACYLRDIKRSEKS